MIQEKVYSRVLKFLFQNHKASGSPAGVHLIAAHFHSIFSCIFISHHASTERYKVPEDASIVKILGKELCTYIITVRIYWNEQEVNYPSKS